MNTNKSIAMVDYAKLFFAVSIVSLHVSNKSEWLNLYAQIVGRLGVPFFFTVAGYFLYAGILKNGQRYIGKYCLRIGKLFGIWLIIYLPIFLYTYRNRGGLSVLIQEIIFLTPGYLWYLSTLCVAALIFGLLYQRKPAVYLLVSAVLYVIGCSGNTYLHIAGLEGLWQPYLHLFLSTRNALFFAPLFLGIGALLKEEKKMTLSMRAATILTALSAITFVVEVLTVQWLDSTGNDHTFYITLPFVVCFLLYVLFHAKCNAQNTMAIRQFSTFLYCCQFGCMVVLELLSSRITFLKHGLFTWIGVVCMAGLSFWILHHHKWGQKILNRLI